MSNFINDTIFVKREAFDPKPLLRLIEEDLSGFWGSATAYANRVSSSMALSNKKQIPMVAEQDRKLALAFEDSLVEYQSENKWLSVTKDYGFWLLRYEPGGLYDEHIDGPVASDNTLRKMTGLVYLNGGFKGGNLKFPRQNLSLTPEPGMLVLFPSSFTHPHEVEQIQDGTRYVIAAHFV